MTDALAKLLYESPAYVACGPTVSALMVGFARMDWWGNIHFTAAGARYLAGLGI
jgi:hypothetical protein